MRGLSGKRGPLKPERNFRERLILPFLATVPVLSAVGSIFLALIDKRKIEDAFLPTWLSLTPLLLAIAFGDLLGRRLAAAMGYRGMILAGRLVETIIAVLTLAAFSIVLGLMDQRAGIFTAALSISILVATGVFGFARRLMGN